IASTASLIGLVPYLATLTLDRFMRVATLTGLSVCLFVASWFTPWFPIAIGACVALAELIRANITSPSPRYRVTAHATLYLPLYFVLVALPVAALWLFHYKGWDTWDAMGYVPAAKSHVVEGIDFSTEPVAGEAKQDIN